MVNFILRIVIGISLIVGSILAVTLCSKNRIKSKLNYHLMDLVSFCKALQLPQEAIDVIQSYNLEQKVYEDYHKLFNENTDLFFEQVKRQTNYRELFLYLYVGFAKETYKQYLLKEISDAVYVDTFSDLAIWCNNCYRDYGVWGLNEVEWLAHHIKMEIFRLGRLQFEPIALEKSLIINDIAIKKGQFVLNVHIPQGQPLDYEACENSYRTAKKFFRGIQPVFVCSSWLLSPNLKDICGRDSNILKFQEKYQIISCNQDSRQAEERVFIRLQDNPNEYPESTSLQRRMKRYLQSGNKIGSATGVIINYEDL